MPKKKAHPSEEDLKAFHEAVKGVKPLKNNKIRLSTRRHPPKVAHRRHQEELPDLTLNEALTLSPVSSEEFIQYRQTGVSHKILRNLRKGQYNVEAKLDLHGMSIEKAIHAVDCFLKQCIHEGVRVALIIHGKGHHSHMPILKNKLNHWLRDIQPVLAFCSAAPTHGSRGAIYVLLKRNPEE